MPITKTAKRALRGSRRKAQVNAIYLAKLEMAVRAAKKSKSAEKVLTAISLADRAAKKHMIHKNKAARIKSALAKLLPAQKSPAKKLSKSSAKKNSSAR
jgi:small subunit ribosomal protein S20